MVKINLINLRLPHANVSPGHSEAKTQNAIYVKQINLLIKKQSNANAQKTILRLQMVIVLTVAQNKFTKMECVNAFLTSIQTVREFAQDVDRFQIMFCAGKLFKASNSEKTFFIHKFELSIIFLINILISFKYKIRIIKS